jgi:hypothetical protein
VCGDAQGFIERQQRQLEQVASKHSRALPEDLDYAGIKTMSKESREKLARFRPQNIGQVRWTSALAYTLGRLSLVVAGRVWARVLLGPEARGLVGRLTGPSLLRTLL